MKDILTALVLACCAVGIGLSTPLPWGSATPFPAEAGWAPDRSAEAAWAPDRSAESGWASDRTAEPGWAPDRKAETSWASDRPAEAPVPTIDDVPVVALPRARAQPAGPIDTNID